MGKWKIALTALGISVLLVPVKIGIHYFKLDMIELNDLIGAIIGGVIFMLAIVLSGVLADFKESELIPGELAGNLRALKKDFELAKGIGGGQTDACFTALSSLVEGIIKQFESNDWKQEELDPLIKKLDSAVIAIAPPLAADFVVKMRSEIDNIERLMSRIEIIEKTDFLPAAYAISQSSIFVVAVILLFVSIKPLIISLFAIVMIMFLLLALLLLIKDMDNPFETGGAGSADVDLRLIYRLREK